MATPRKRKKTSRDAYIRTWATESETPSDEQEPEERPARSSRSLVDDADLPLDRPLKLARPPRGSFLDRDDDAEPPPKPGGQSSEIHSSTVLQAMELRVDSISEALHAVEKRQAALERRIEETISAARTVSSLSAPAASPPSIQDEPFLSKGPTMAPPPAVPAMRIEPLASPLDRPRRWPIWLFALILGAVATFVATYLGVGGEGTQVSIRDLTTGNAPKIDPQAILDAVNRITIAIGVGVMIVIGGLITLIRGARYRARLEDGQR